MRKKSRSKSKSKTKNNKLKNKSKSRGKASSRRQRGKKIIVSYRRKKNKNDVKIINDITLVENIDKSGKAEKIYDEDIIEEKQLSVSSLPSFYIQRFFQMENKSIEQINNQLKNCLVSGLLSFNVLYNPVCNKIVYLLGEQHSFENMCEKDDFKASELFFKIINANDGNKLDVFLESIYEPINPKCIRIQKDRQYCHSFLTSVMINLGLENCLSTLHEGCRYFKDYIRFHSVDVRSLLLPFFRYCYLIRNIKQSKNLEQAEPFMQELMNNYIYKEMFSDINQYYEIVREMMIFTKINKQLENINPNIKQLLEQELSEIVTEQFYIFNYNNVLDFCKTYYNFKLVKKNVSPSLEDMTTVNRDFLIYPIVIDAVFMDLYNIGRIFRKFKHPPKASVNIQSFPETPSNIIIYAGNYHIGFYLEIFTKMGFINIFRSKSTNNISCLKLENFNIKWICKKRTDSTCIYSHLNSNIIDWTVDDVLQWFNFIEKYISPNSETVNKIKEIIQENKIDGKKLLSIQSSNELTKIGIVFGPAIKLFRQIESLKYYL